MILVRNKYLSLINITRAISSKGTYPHDMPNPRVIAAELLKKRKEGKSRAKGTYLNRAHVQVIGSSCQGVSPSLLVCSEGNAYLFNCGEGTQRNCYANRIRVSNLEHLFVTKRHWPSIAGAYGLSLTIQDVGLPSFTIHTPGDISEFFQSAESFMSFTTGIECNVTDCSDTEFDDSRLRVKCISLDGKSEQDHSDDDEVRKKKVKRSPSLVAFHCSLPDLPGPLDPKRCRELRVPIGPLLARLKSGHDVQIDDGTIIKSSDVCGPKNVGPNFIIVDCPSFQYVDLLFDNEQLSRLRERRTANGELEVDLVFHFSPREVIDSERYKLWMNGFGSECRHILIVNNNFRKGNFVDVYKFQYLLNKLDPAIFPKLYLPPRLADATKAEIEENSRLYADKIPETNDNDFVITDIGDLKDSERTIEASTFDTFNLRPNMIYQSVESKTSMDSIYCNAKFEPCYEETFTRYTDATKNLPPPEPHEPEIVFLGTGSALPSKLRNTSCILVNLYVPRKASVILDCGEDSYGQIVRHYGPDGAQTILKNLKLVYVSHHHADHHVGLIEILRQRKQANIRDKLQLILPPGIDRLLNFHNSDFEDLSDTYSITCSKDLRMRTFESMSSEPASPASKSICDKLGDILTNIAVVNVEHCSHSCAVVMDFDVGRPTMKKFRLSYSGDARPSESFAKLGEGSDLLIHEATFDHTEIGSALEKKHSTTLEAIEMGKRMRAKFTILTHFSQKYPKIPYFTKEFDDKVGFAFDNLVVRCPSHLPRLPVMKDLLKVVFAKSINEIDARHAKMETKKELLTNLFN